MRRLNRFLVVAIIVTLLVPGFVIGAVVQACCGVTVNDLQVTDAPDPVCSDGTATISGTYYVYTVWGGWTEAYDTGIKIRIYDSDMNMVADYLETLGTEQPNPGMYPGTKWSFSYDWSPTAAGTFTYEVIAWSETGYGRMEISVVGETITVVEGECPTISCLVEQEIRDRWDAECVACDDAKNHGQYVSCRAKIVSEYVEMGLVDEEGSSCLINPEARTDCGKK
jgi:hypothetical protein